MLITILYSTSWYCGFVQTLSFLEIIIFWSSESNIFKFPSKINGVDFLRYWINGR